jgi:hypothetical protein
MDNLGPSASADPPALSLDGVRMRPIATSAGSVISAETVFEFTQNGPIVSARYTGGRIVLGVLVGVLDSTRLTFRYAQVHDDSGVNGGRSDCDLSRDANGRLRLTEHFTWDADLGSGTNVLESLDPAG